MADPSSARVVPRPRNFSWTRGWQTTPLAGLAAIQSRYGSPGSPGSVSFGGGGPDEIITGAPPNPNLSFSEGVANPVTASDANMMRDASARVARDMPVAANTAQREQNLAATEEAGNIRAAQGMIPNMTPTRVQPGVVTGATISPTA